MARLFMPSCRNTASYKRSVQRLGQYLYDRGFVDGFTGCCKPDGPGHADIPGDVELVVICNTCSGILKESKPGHSVINAFELILMDKSFQYPNYRGESITIQDCWRARNQNDLHDVVRQLLYNMNLVPVELEENRANSRFCGLTTLQPMPQQVEELAPILFGNVEEDMFVQHDKDTQVQLMKEHVSQITTPRVTSYCSACDQGLNIGGAESTSLLNLLFDRVI